MPEIVEDFQFSPRCRGPQRYPWDEWLDGQTRKFKPGVDFKVSVKSFRAVICASAKRRGLVPQSEIRNGAVFFKARPAGVGE